MKRVFYILIFIFIYSALTGQNDQGVITFERRTFWINISSKLPWMSQEEIDRNQLTWGKRQGKWAQEYELHFDRFKSVYKEKENEDNYGYSRRDEQYFLSRNMETNKMKDVLLHLDKAYKVEGDIPKFKWKILNEIREINGFLCMKAMTMDPVKDIPVIAWFTDQIPFSGGPEGYGGLPGMILMLDIDGGVIIESTSIDLEKIPELTLPKKLKGKKIGLEDFRGKMRKDIAKAMKNKRNPYWYIRY